MSTTTMQAQILVAANQPQALPAKQEIVLPTADLSLTVIVILSTVFSNVLGWMATRAVNASDKRIDQNALLIAAQQTQIHELEQKITQNYVNKDDFVHRYSLMDAHIEKLGDRVNDQNVLLKSIEAVLRERCTLPP